MRTWTGKADAASLERAASFLRAGALVAFPTETVYGLGADARNDAAVEKIFRAKGRPADNPLIAHVTGPQMAEGLVRKVDARARRLMEAFWPGPLTLVMESAGRLSPLVTAGLDTVGVRMPAHPVAQALLARVGFPLAAPSANRSGRPSPTTAEHVRLDMDGRIACILDGGPCRVGVESTVLDLSGDRCMILRPGGVTIEMIREIIPEIQVSDATLRPLQEGIAALSPGMKHRHYAPKANVTIFDGGAQAVHAAIRARYDGASAGERMAILCPAADAAAYGGREVYPLGASPEDMAAHLFDALRALDARGVTHILAQAVDTGGMGLALMNRLLRAADFDVVRL